MSETVEKKIPRTVKDRGIISGVWRLEYKLTNRHGAQGFSGRMLTSYVDPVTGAQRHLYDTYGNQLPGYFIQRQVTRLYPDKNPGDATIVDFLVGHPEVGVEQNIANFPQGYRAIKKNNPRITIVNVDYEEVSDLEEKDYIDKLVGRLSMDTGSQAIGLDRLRFILNAFNKPYREAKYITNPKIEKQKLRDRLKEWVRSDIENARNVNDIIDDLDYHKYSYEIKEMVRLGILNVSNGMYKYQTQPLSISVDGVVQYFQNNPDFYAEITKTLYAKLKQETGQ